MNNQTIITYILNFAVLAVPMVFCLWFFVKQKSYRLLALYFTVLVAFAGIFVADWFYLDELDLAKAGIEVIVIFMVVAMLVVYQSEFKTMFFNLSKKEKSKEREYSDEDLRIAVSETVKACQNMSKSRVGALIVFAPTKIAKHILDTGTDIGGKITSPLLESIFNTKSPLHDGAIVVKGDQVLAAGCFLPLSQSQNLSKDIGTRHRAAIGITEETDMLAVVVSEENGIISIAKKGELKRYITPEKLTETLSELYGIVRITKKKYITNI